MLPFIPFPTNFIISVPMPDPPAQIELDFGQLEENPKKSDGCFCRKCKEFYPYAEANQEDGTLICYACRHGL